MAEKKKRKPRIPIECDDLKERQKFRSEAQADGMTVTDWVKFKCFGNSPKKRVPNPWQLSLMAAFEQLRKLREQAATAPAHLQEPLYHGILTLARHISKAFDDSKVQPSPKRPKAGRVPDNPGRK